MSPTRKLKLAATLSVVVGIIAPIVINSQTTLAAWQHTTIAYIGVALILVGFCVLVSTNRKDHP